MKRLIDYVKAIEGLASPCEIMSSDLKSETKHDATGSNIEITKQVHYFTDGVSVEYKREYDNGAPYPGCKEFWYSYRLVNSNKFEFEGNTSQLFQSHSEVDKWLKCDILPDS
ncbi:hypothetical protein A2T98_09745 [Nodularia spumigena CENA596]|uniref:Uncharacterized protein n=1 Tax=Nodularia spumigena CENA596 TaxID=1819295 RepID=A0A161VS46_NODSP|nr:hypothetical protein [Nodularia spumigena]KZL49995.1 hypothetical protein A2T98_09745 [Nodularia spumigena CENA596]